MYDEPSDYFNAVKLSVYNDSVKTELDERTDSELWQLFIKNQKTIGESVGNASLDEVQTALKEMYPEKFV